MNELESIDVIKRMIANSKRNLKLQSPFYLLWGWVVFIATAVNFIFYNFIETEFGFLVWPLAIGIGIIGSIVLGIKTGKTEKRTTFVDRAMGYLWSGWLIFFFIMLAVTSVNNLSWGKTYSMIIGLYGLGTYISGGILKFRPLLIGGLLSFAIALGCVVSGIDSNISYMMMALAVSIVVSYLIPGYMLRKTE